MSASTHKVEELTNTEKIELESRSAKALPTDPSKSGWSAEQIKKKFYEAIIYLFDLVKKENGEVRESFTQVASDINSLIEDINKIKNGSIVSGRATSDNDGYSFTNDYAKIANIVNGTIGALKYKKTDGTLANISDLEITGQIVDALQNDSNFQTSVQNAINGILETTSANSLFLSKAEASSTYATKTAFQTLQTQIESLADTYGVRFYGTSVGGVRTGKADGLSSTPQYGSTTGSSAFDIIKPWSELEAVEVVARDSSGNALLDSENNEIKNKFIKLPQCYLKITKGTDNNGTYIEYQVCKIQKTGFKPMLLKNDGTPADYVLVGAYESGWLTNTSGLVGSSSGKSQVINLAPVSVKSLFSYAETSDVALQRLDAMSMQEYNYIQVLFMIEFATRKSRSIFNGVLSGKIRDTTNTLQFTATSTLTNTNSITVASTNDLANIQSGDDIVLYVISAETDDLGNKPKAPTIRQVTNVVDNGNSTKTITFNGEPITISTDYMNFASRYYKGNTGKTDVITSSSGCLTSITANTPFVYRGFENIWADGGSYVDNVCMFRASPSSKSKFKTFTHASGEIYSDPSTWGGCNEDLLCTGGWTNDIAMDDNFIFVGIYSSSTTSTNTTNYCDWIYNSSSTASKYYYYKVGQGTIFETTRCGDVGMFAYEITSYVFNEASQATRHSTFRAALRG